MAEKKPGFFSRLFGKKQQITHEEVEVVAQENLESAPEESAPSVVQDSVKGEDRAIEKEAISVEIVDTIAEGIITEAKESIQKQDGQNSLKVSTIEDGVTLKAQHGFIAEIATEAQAAIRESEVDSQQLFESTSSIDTTIDGDQEIRQGKDSLEGSIVDQNKHDMDAKSHEFSDKQLQSYESNTQKEHLQKAHLQQEPVQESHGRENEVRESYRTADRPEKKSGFFSRLSQKLSKTRDSLTAGLAELFLGRKEINEEILEELETRLLMADVGINVTTQLLDQIRDSQSRKSLSNVDELLAALKAEMKEILEPVSQPLVIDDSHTPYVILMIGVNGVGKTTTIGKLAKKFQSEGKSVMLAAGDTFRAAAVEQLEVWGERNHIPVISQKEGADPASVIFDAMQSAKAKKIDILIADTAGRLHTDSGLMQELAKINRVIKRHDESAPHEVMLVVDASTGQNALNQAKQFNTTIPLTGITFTKLDGTAKGGIIFAIAEELQIPIRFIGVGETIDDLRPFDAEEFVDALIE